MTRDTRMPGVAIALALAAGGAHFHAAPSFLRVAVILLFLAVGPGLALVGLLDVDDPLEELLLVVGLSLVVDLLVAESLVLGSAFSADTCVPLLMAIAIGGALAHIVLVPEAEP
jgi:hypothetical protein